MPSLSDYEAQHIQNLAKLSGNIKALYFRYIEKIFQKTTGLKLAEGQVYNLDRFPAFKRQLDELLKQMSVDMQGSIVNAIKQEWQLSNSKNDDWLNMVIKDRTLPESVKERFFDKNISAMNQFLARKEAGFSISDRIWNRAQQFRQQVETQLFEGITEGRSAASMATDLKRNLSDPDKLFRRVRDKYGDLKLSRAAKQYHPGQGKYRSSYQNALRLSRTEVNMSYRASDHERWKKTNFILGFEVKLSGNHPVVDICFINWNYKVYTSKGPKPIAKIKVGDLVLTHKAKYRKVLEVFKTPAKEVDMVEIITKCKYDKNSRINKISSTHNHPFLVNGFWVPASEIKAGDKVEVLAGRCKECGKKIPYYRDYCSKSCSSKVTAINQHKRPEHENALRIKRLKLISDNGGRMPWLKEYVDSGKNIANLVSPETRLKIADSNRRISKEKMAAGTHQFQNPENRKKLYKSIQLVSGSNNKKHSSFIERKMAWLLDQKKIEYIHNFPFARDVCYGTSKTNRMYFIDFVLKDHKIAIEVDGEYWHNNREEYDSKRKAEIESKGYTVLRFPGEQVRKRLNECSEEIDRVLMNHTNKYEFMEMTVESVRNWHITDKERKALTKYNLSVAVDNSYIINGYVVHNCDDAKGKYPKEFKFIGWHPACRCYAVPIRPTEDQMGEYFDHIMEGKDPAEFKFSGQVENVPPGLTQWLDTNKDRIAGWKNTPYFIRDNFKNGNTGSGLLFKTPNSVNIPNPKIVIPKELLPDGDYFKGTGIIMKQECFDLIDPNKPVKLAISNKERTSYYDPASRTVHILNDARNAKSKWHRESVIYHEYGHAIDYQRGLLASPEISALMGKYRKSMNKRVNISYWDREFDGALSTIINIKKQTQVAEIGAITERLKRLYVKLQKTSPDVFTRHGISKGDVLEQIGSTEDALMSINPNYGFGHSKAYFKHTGMKETEFIAHCFENTFAGNDIFKKYLPELYNEMINYVKGLK